MNQQVFPCFYSILTGIQSYQSKVTPIGLLDNEKTAETHLLYEFTIAFPASLLWKLYNVQVWSVQWKSVYCTCGKCSGVQYTVYCVQFTMYSVQWTVYSAPCTVYCVQFIVYSVLCTVYCVQCTVYRVQFTVYSLLCTVYCVHLFLWRYNVAAVLT